MARENRPSSLRYVLVLVVVVVSVSGVSTSLGTGSGPCWNEDICHCQRPRPSELILTCTCTSSRNSLEISAPGHGERSLPQNLTELTIQSCANVTVGQFSIAKLNITSIHFSGIETLILKKEAFSQLARLTSIGISTVRHLAAEEQTFSNVTSDILSINNATWPVVKSKTFSDVRFTNIEISGSKFGDVERKGLEFRNDVENVNISHSVFGHLQPYSFYVGYVDLFSMTDCQIEVFHENSTKLTANSFEFVRNKIGKVTRYAIYLHYHFLLLQSNSFGHTAELAFREVVPNKQSLISPEIEFQLVGNTFARADPHSLVFGDEAASGRDDSNFKILVQGNKFNCDCSPLQWLLQLKQRDNTSDYFTNLYETSLCNTSPRMTVKDYADATLNDDGTCPEDVPARAASTPSYYFTLFITSVAFSFVFC